MYQQVGILLRCASASDIRFILIHALQTPSISEWGAELIQLPDVQYVTLLSIQCARGVVLNTWSCW
jgi:hypothetical protein